MSRLESRSHRRIPFFFPLPAASCQLSACPELACPEFIEGVEGLRSRLTLRALRQLLFDNIEGAASQQCLALALRDIQ